MKALPLLAVLSLLFAPLRAEAQVLGTYDPEESCDGPVATPVCAYKTWFFCRIAGVGDMCSLVLGRGPMKEWEDKPWLLPLSQLIAGPLLPHGYAFVGALKADSTRLEGASDQTRARLLGTTEVMDTYANPEHPEVAIIGSEFYAETKPGEWTLIGWSLSGEGGTAATECDDPKLTGDNICKLRVSGIKSWAQMLRGINTPKN